jgi:purine-binding chemotaxis protein CheW
MTMNSKKIEKNDGDRDMADGLLVTGFVLGDADYGIDARLVQEVVKVGELTRVHDAPPDIIGIRNLRGRIITVVDMAVHLKLGSVEIGPESRLLIMEHQGESYGFLVDAVTDAISLDEGLIGAPPASLDAALRRRLRGVWRESNSLTSILDPRTLFQWEDINE